MAEQDKVKIGIFRVLLAPVKIVAFVLHTLFCYLLFIILLLPVAVFGVHKIRWKNNMMKLWASIGLKIMGVRVHVTGSIPEPPFFLVSNHLSYLDIPVYYSILDTTFVSKAEVKHWPVIGWMARTLNIIFVDRRKRSDVVRVNHEITDGINNRQGVLMFPEATTSPGETVLRFRGALLGHAAETGTKVSYAALRYSTGENDYPAHVSVCWWGKDMPMHKHLIKLLSNKAVTAEVIFGEETVSSSERKELAQLLEENVKKLFKPIVTGANLEYNPEDF